MKNVLVCDRDYDTVEAISLYLLQEGYKVYKAYDGEEALHITERENIHLLITDIVLPKLDGIHVILKIREKIENNPREPRYLKLVWGTGYKVG